MVDPTPSSGIDLRAGKIDYSNDDPIAFKKTATLVNYFIINTSQFLNTFSQVAEGKLHQIDDKLDEIEQILSLYEAKLDSVPEEYFEDLPDVPQAAPREVVVVARTENPLLNAQKANAKPVAKEAQVQKAAAGATVADKGYVPPPPKEGAKLPVPAGMPPAKMFPISTAAPPASMTFPNIQSAAPNVVAPPTGGDPQATVSQDAAQPEADDGFTPQERRKNQLEEDPYFKSKYLMMKRMRIPLANIRAKIRDTEKDYKKEDIDLFATDEEIKEANFMLI